MIKLFTEEEFDNAKSTDKLAIKCEFCGKIFYREKKEIKYAEKPGNEKRCRFCCKKCGIMSAKNTIIYNCDNCGREFYLQNHLNKTKGTHHFCSKSCSATYNNLHKIFGTRVSKLEAFLSKKLKEKYPSIKLLLNDKTAIGSELDFYFPELQIAFEINGIVHYKPIYGEHKYKKIVENDLKKIEKCRKENIDLHIIDVSSQKYFKETTSLVFLNKIIFEIEKILKNKIGK